MEFSPEKQARIDRVRRFANVRLVLNDLGIPFEERKRNDLWFKCPVPTHREKDASTHICSDPTDTHHAQWKCFGCKESGDVIHLVRMMTTLTFWESIQWLEVRLGDEDVEQVEKEKPKSPTLPEYYEAPERATEWTPAYLEYLTDRGIPWYQIVTHKLGYVDRGRYRWRIIVPVMLGYKLCTWVGRAIISKRSRITSCENGLVGLFGSELAKPKLGPAIVVEGWTDALRLERLGFKNVMALQTNMLHDVQFDFLSRFPYIVVMPDHDSGGDFLVNSLAPYIERHEFYMAYLAQEGADPDNAEDDDVVGAMENLVEWEPKILVPEFEVFL